MYYAEELLLRDIGEVLGVTESRVSQIHSRALYKLNRQLAALSGREEA
jgi:RNA polymerase sigma factor for flagellar operon FliA